MSAPAAGARSGQRAAGLRLDFDRQFAQPETSAADGGASVLALRFDTAPYAVSLAEVAEVGRTPPILAVPSSEARFLGLITVRGALIPVYDLASLLGHSRAASGDWMFLVRDPHAIAYVFDEFEGHRQVGAAERAGNAVRDGNVWRPLISLSSLTNTLQE